MDDASPAPDSRRAGLLTIDVQRDVALRGAPSEVAGTADALAAMRHVVEAFRRARRPVIHMVRLYQPDGSNVDLCRREASIRSSCAGANFNCPGRPSTRPASGTSTWRW